MLATDRRTTERLAFQLQKTSPAHQAVFSDIEKVVRPAIEAWSRVESARTVGLDVGTRYTWVNLGRRIWRGVVVGQTFQQAPSDLAGSISWQRNGDKLITSLFNDVDSDRSQWVSTSYLNEVRTSGAAPLRDKIRKFFSRFPLPLSDIPACFETDRPFLAFLCDSLCVLSKRIPRRNAEVTIFLDLLSREFRPLLVEGFLHRGWAVKGLKRKTTSFEIPTASPLPPIDLPSGATPLTSQLVADALRTWTFDQPSHWARVKHEKASLERHLRESHSSGYALLGHPDLSPYYLARAEACGALGIPVIEVQHGSYFSRFDHAFTRSCQVPSDLHFCFGTNTEAVLAAHPQSRPVPGVFVRTRLLIRKSLKPIGDRPLRVFVGSYFVMDFDECELPGDEAAIVSQEVQGLKELSRQPGFEIFLKLRPRVHGSIYGHLDAETRRRIHLVGSNEKAGQRMVSQYDIVVNFHFSTLGLEAVSAGVPLVYCPPPSEHRQLRPEFLSAIQKSPDEIRICGVNELAATVGDMAKQVLDASTHSLSPQSFSTQYSRFATPAELRKAVGTLHTEILKFPHR